MAGPVATSCCPAVEHCAALEQIFLRLDLATLRQAKRVACSWRTSGRRVLCSAQWQKEHWQHLTDETRTTSFGATRFVAHRRYQQLANPRSARQGVVVKAIDTAARQARAGTAPVLIKKIAYCFLAEQSLPISSDGYVRSSKRLLCELRLLRHFRGHANL